MFRYYFQSSCTVGGISRETGANLVEYTILVALITLVCLAGVNAIGVNVETSISASASNLD